MLIDTAGYLSTAKEALEDFLVPHKKYDEVEKCIASEIFVSQGGEVIGVVGPNRVGKTTAAYNACKKIVPHDPTNPSDIMPLVRLRLRNALKNGHFDSKTFIQLALTAIRHPIYGIPDPDDPFGIKFDRMLDKTNERTLTNAFIRAIEIRKTIYFLIDEIQHLKNALRGLEGAAAFLDNWKSIAEDTGIVLILVGTYPSLDIFNLSPHLLGRTGIIEFQRYQGTSDDLKNFKRILVTLDKIVPMDKGKLSSHIKYLYQGSLGCIGLLLRWVRSAIGSALAKGNNYVELSDFKATSKRKIDLDTLANEIILGESNSARYTTIQRSTTGTPENTSKDKEETPKKKKKTPFQQKARNHKVGNR
jgi:hypothetical protein